MTIEDRFIANLTEATLKGLLRWTQTEDYWTAVVSGVCTTVGAGGSLLKVTSTQEEKTLYEVHGAPSVDKLFEAITSSSEAQLIARASQQLEAQLEGRAIPRVWP
jgi:hypothetical protein